MKQRRMKYEVGGAAARVNVPHGSLDVINIPGSPCLDSIVTPFSAHRVSQRGRLSRIRGRRHVGEYAESVVFKIEISAYSAVFTFHRKYRCANNEKNHPRRIAAAESFAIRRPSTTAIDPTAKEFSLQANNLGEWKICASQALGYCYRCRLSHENTR